MLRYTLRRVLWSIPTLLVTTLVLFLVTTLAPDPLVVFSGPRAREAKGESAAGAEIAEARRSQFFDLPRFVNADPKDVRSHARDALSAIASADLQAQEVGARELRRLGGAALPYVLPSLDALPPDARARAAVDLAPIATRMGLTSTDLSEPEKASLFWSRFWDDRALDFARAAVDRAVSRLVDHGSALRERDLITLDTFALPEIVHAIAAQGPNGSRETLERLTRIAQHVSERGPIIARDAPSGDVRRDLADWQEWWFVHANDFVVIEGADRGIAIVTETRYGKWLRRAGSGELGMSAIDGAPITDKLRERAPVTLLLCSLAMAVSWALAVPLGAVGAWRRGRPLDVASSAILFVLYATPTFAIAELLRRISGAETGRLSLAVAALAAGSLATCSRWQRTAMLDVIRQDFVRTAHAKGLPVWRVLVFHALRNALMPTVTLAGLHLPALLGGALVVEDIFGLPGLGYETLRAVEARDAAWLMAVVLIIAVVITFGLVATDIAYGAMDPRVRALLVRRQGGSA